MRYDNLPDDVKADILKYEIGVDLLYDITLSDLLDIFARINTYSVVLNTQEKLNAKYLGVFKVYAYELGHTYAHYFVSEGVLTKKAVSRMAEAQLSSDLLVALSGGVQTVKNIERFYRKYENCDELPAELATARATFNNAMSFVGNIYPSDDLRETNWSRPHWFYTLFICVANSLGGVGGLENFPSPELNLATAGRWRAQLDELSAQYDVFTSDDAPDMPREFERFIDFSRRRTTDTDARLGRAKFVLDALMRRDPSMGDLTALLPEYHSKIDALQLALHGRPYAPWAAEDRDIAENSLFEGTFLRAFTTFEGALQELFLHYAVGGASLTGYVPGCRLTNCSDGHVRAILRGNQRFTDWANPQVVRERADLFFESGEPFRTGFAPRSHALTDIQKLRNAIAHESSEAESAYLDVQINNLKTEPPFFMSPGQLLRTRRRGNPPMSWCAHYLAVLSTTVGVIAQGA